MNFIFNTQIKSEIGINLISFCDNFNIIDHHLSDNKI